MIQRLVLITFVFTISLCASTWCVAQVAPDAPPTLTLTLRGIELRLPLSKVLPKEYLFWARAKPSDLKIDYLKSDPPHPSFSALAAEAVTVGELCHVGRLHPTLQIVQSCPAPEGTKTRLDAWRDFLSGKRTQLPPGAQVYVVRNGTDIFQVVRDDLKKKPVELNKIFNRKIPISTKISPPCQFPPSANGKKITQLCARSLPVSIPDFSASIKEIDRWKGELVVTRLMPGPSSALLALQAGTGRQVRVRVNVEAPSCEFWGRRYKFGDTATAYAKSVIPQGQTCTGIPLICAPENLPVPLKGRWLKTEGTIAPFEIEFNPSAFFSSCQVQSPPSSSSSSSDESSDESSSLPQSQSSSSEETLGLEVELGRPKEVEVTACGDGKVEGREECEDDIHCAAHQLEQVGRLSGMKCVDCVCVEPTCGNGKKDDTEECDESTPDGTAGEGGIGSLNFQCASDRICFGCKCYGGT